MSEQKYKQYKITIDDTLLEDFDKIKKCLQGKKSKYINNQIHYKNKNNELVEIYFMDYKTKTKTKINITKKMIRELGDTITLTTKSYTYRNK